MLEVHTYTLGTLDTNCYLVVESDSRRGVLIDPADDGDFLSEEIGRKQVFLSAILLTHGHCDHVLGLLSLKLNFPDIPIYIHAADLPLISLAQESAQHWFKREVDPVPKPTHTYRDGLSLELGMAKLEIIETPGHTPGSVSIFAAVGPDVAQPLLFCGDLIFKNGVGRTDFSYSQPMYLERSIRALQQQLPSQTLCYSGHGEEFILGERV